MKDVHVTPELLRALHELELPGEVMFRLIWEHFQALCPICKAAVDEWLAEAKGTNYDSAFENARKKTVQKVEDAEALKRVIDREVREILRLDPDEAVERIEGASKRFRSPHLIDRLLDEAGKHLHGDPRRAVELLRAARAIAERRADPLSPEWRIRVLLHYANALRASRRLREAERWFAATRDLIQEEPAIDYELFGLRASFEGSFSRDRKNYEKAERLFGQAVLIYRIFGDEMQAAKNLLKLASIHHLRGRNEEAVEALHEAVLGLDPTKDTKLMAIAVQNLAFYRCEVGDPAGARRLLCDEHAVLERYVIESGAEAFRLLVVWLEGRIARDLEEYERAETKLLSAAQGFSDLEIGYDTALILLDLADSYLMAGDGEAVRRLVPEIEPLLAANDLDQEIIAALLLFQDSITQDLLSRSTVAMVRRKMQKVGRVPRNRAN